MAAKMPVKPAALVNDAVLENARMTWRMWSFFGMGRAPLENKTNWHTEVGTGVILKVNGTTEVLFKKRGLKYPAHVTAHPNLNAGRAPQGQIVLFRL